MPLVAGENQLILRLLDRQWSGFYFSLVPRNRIDPSPFRALWARLAGDFPVATHRMQADTSVELLAAWFRDPDRSGLLPRLIDRAATRWDGSR